MARVLSAYPEQANQNRRAILSALSHSGCNLQGAHAADLHPATILGRSSFNGFAERDDRG